MTLVRTQLGTIESARRTRFEPTGTISATDAQEAIEEVAAESQALDSDLTAIAALATTGILARTAANTWALRTITGTANQVTVTDGDGVAGDPTLALPQSIHTAASVTFGNLTLGNGGAVRTGQTAADTLLLQAYDVDGAAYVTFGTLTAGDDPSFGLDGVQLTDAVVTNDLTPSASDGAGLGTALLPWSDLFLASGAVVNFNAGDITITHSAGALAFAGGNFDFETVSINGGTAITAFLDEDTMSSNSATAIVSQQSIVAYVAAQIAALVDSSPAALDTLNELAAALGDDANFSTTVTNALAAKLAIASNLSDVANAATAFGNIKQAATSSLSGVVELTIASEVTAGTDSTRAITPAALAGSNYGTAVQPILVFDDSQDVAVGNGAGDVFWRVPSTLNGWVLIGAAASVETAGATNATTIQVHNITQGVDMLSSLISIASGAVDGTGTVNTANDDVATGDRIRFDCDTVSTTAPKGLLVELQFRLP